MTGMSHACLGECIFYGKKANLSAEGLLENDTTLEKAFNAIQTNILFCFILFGELNKAFH
jgi:hypothetical protein